MDLWTGEVQNAVITLVVTALGIVAAWIGAKGRAYLTALESKAVAEARVRGGELMAEAAETAVRAVEALARNAAEKLMSAEKRALAVKFFLRLFPDADEELAGSYIEAALSRLQGGWYGLPTETAMADRLATAEDRLTELQASLTTAKGGAPGSVAKALGLEGVQP